ncbi:DIP1984 family protein [Anaerobiospirillum sp. NML120449]|uniref:DIP1984 family protein n=1 Tax=Anaerobiospirillum sp. NML120449 TaxID=2932817 RepID=UPI001FF3784E|nr:DIP1984 family protein [Anaerobiospirillum sp. NML120449]MCK0526453.1 DIP1984 family protein [Anaerobiospirillum sp. NML120449]
MKVKLAEALQERADLQRQINQLRSRAMSAALMQEGSEPLENPESLFTELESLYQRLEHLIYSINMTNSRSMLEGKPVTWYLSRRDILNLKIRNCRDILDVARTSNMRARGGEIKILPAVDIKAHQQKLDILCSELRKVDNSIQQFNWSADLIEE